MKDKAIIFDWIGTLYERDKGLFSFSKEVLINLHPYYKLGLISKRKNPGTGYLEIQRTGIVDYFDSIIIARRKTLTEFKKCLAELDLTPECVAVVGDRTIREIRIGNVLGCTIYWIKAGEHSSELPNRRTGQPNYVINSINDLSDFLLS